MSGVDDLFSAEAPAPVKDRLGTVERLLAVALPLNALGIFCFTGVPGAVLALFAWHMADEEVLRCEGGALPPDRLVRARRLRGLGFGMVLFAVASLVVQVFLFTIGFYQGIAIAIGVRSVEGP